MCAALTKEQILAANDITLEELDMTPYGWPGTVFIGVLRGVEAEKIANLYRDGIEKQKNYVAIMASYFLRDANGERIFSDADRSDLNQKAGRALQAINEAGVRLNKLDEEAVTEAKKNSGTTDGDASSTD